MTMFEIAMMCNKLAEGNSKEELLTKLKDACEDLADNYEIWAADYEYKMLSKEKQNENLVKSLAEVWVMLMAIQSKMDDSTVADRIDEEIEKYFKN